MEELRRNRRLVLTHRKLIEMQATRVAEAHAALAACEEQRLQTFAKLETFGDSGLFKPGNISKTLRDLSARKLQLQKDLAVAEREQAKLEIIVERLKEKQTELEQAVADEEMAESIEDWTMRDVAEKLFSSPRN